MKRILRGAVLLAVTAVLGACGTEPDQVKGGTADHIVADPGVVFISREDSQAVKIRLEDVQGTALHDPITISNIGAGINVRPDSAFRPIFTDGDSLVFNTNGTELRVWVSTSALANSSFTINAGGLTLNVPVVVTPNKAESFPFSNLAPVLGEVVTATATSDLLFTDSTKVVFGADTLTPVSVAPDGSSLTFNVGPDLLGPGTFTNVTLSYNKSVVFPVTATDTLNSPSSSQSFVFSNPTPGLGQAITVTPPAGVAFSATTKVSMDSLGPVPHFTIAGDGSSMTMTAGPNSVGPTTFTNMVRPDNPTFKFTLKSVDTLKSAGVSTFLATVSSTTPAANAPVTFTGASSLYQFDADNSTVLVNDIPSLLLSVAADSSSAVVLPMPGITAGTTSVVGPVVAGFLLDELPTNAPAITVGALTPQAGTSTFPTAPTINAPAIGSQVAFWDGAPYDHAVPGDFGSGERLYKFVVPATQSFRFQLPYISDESDLGIYLYNGNLTKNTFSADAGAEGDPEDGTVELAAGTYYIAIVWFNYTPAAAHYSFSVTGVETEE